MITIKSDKIKVGNKLTCIKQYTYCFKTGSRYKIVKITDDEIKMSDGEYRFPSTFSMDKNSKPNIFEYFKVW